MQGHCAAYQEGENQPKKGFAGCFDRDKRQ